MTEKDKWVEAISQINKLTQDKKLQWKSDSPPDSMKDQGSEYQRVEIMFHTTFKGRWLGIFERYWERSMGGTLADIVLAFLDDQGRILWEFGDIVGLRDLMDSVRFQVANVDEFLDSLFEEEES